MSTKAQVKQVNELIRKEEYAEAANKAQDILSKDSKNLNAFLLLGFAQEKLNHFDNAENSYRSAAALNPDHPAAWQGFCKLAERQGAKGLPLFKEALEHLSPILMEANQVHRLRDLVDRFLDLAATTEDKLKYVDALQLITPDNAAYSSLEGMVPHPKVTINKIVTLTENEEKCIINTLIGERRTRLGAVYTTVSQEVRREVFSKSKLEYWIRLMVNWCNDDDLRREYEEKLLQHCLDKLEAQRTTEEKTKAREKVLDIANGMVVVRHPYKLAWDLSIEWQDHKDVAQYDVVVLREYCLFFPDSDLCKVITAFLTSELSPFAPEQQAPESDSNDDSSSDDDDGGVPTTMIPTTEEDRIIMLTEGSSSTESLLAYRLMGAYYVHLEEWDLCSEVMKKALKYAESEKKRSGLLFLETTDVYRIYLGTSLVYYQSPRNHADAMKLFETVLERDPMSTSAMIGVGLIFEEEEELEKASDFLSRALQRDPSNIKVKSEAGWVKAQLRQYEMAEVELRECLDVLTKQKSPSPDLLAQVQYRIGFCIWEQDSSKAARKNRKGAYSFFLAALKSDLNYAPAYSMMGLYYLNYARDKKRARQCFQKALELSANEVVAAEQLARSYANDGDWEKVELIARRIVDSGKVRPPPGSKRQGISWPFSALGTACLNKQDFTESITNFQAALRMAPKDYHSWVSLGESYYRSGRHIAATKAIVHAQHLESEGLVQGLGDTWFTQYLLANIKRDLGDFESAIALYKEIYQTQKEEQGIVISLLQTLVDGALDSIEKGLYGQAAHLASEAIIFGKQVGSQVSNAFNFWKSIGDAASVFASVRSRLEEVPFADLEHVFSTFNSPEADMILAEFDGVTFETLAAESGDNLFQKCTRLMILGHKRAIHVSASDIHARAVAYYNLGWAEHKAHLSLPLKKKRGTTSKFSKTAVRAFKRAIELEAKNAEFWNALGVATTQIHPQVAQHAFVRSLHLDERSPATWTNYGVLALGQNDLETASAAFTRAQSNDPDYADAWIGHAYIQKMLGNEAEFRAQITHAISLSPASNLAVRQQYGVAMFDHIVTTPESQLDDTALIEPLFSLSQAKTMDPYELAYPHLYTLFQERMYDHACAVPALENLAETLEGQYEATENPELLGRFVIAKADLARSYLASKDYENAIEAGDIAISLTAEVSDKELTPEQRSKARLSAHLTVGLAQYFSNNIEEAVTNFEVALAETKGHPDAVCLLAQVLWATGTAANRDLARDKLFDQIGLFPDHIPSVLLLAVISVLDNDTESLDAAISDLHEKRMTTGLNEAAYRQIGDVLSAVEALTPGRSFNDIRSQMQTDILLHPDIPHTWTKLAAFEGLEKTMGELAVDVARQGVPPRGNLKAEDVAVAYATTKKAADAQVAIFFAPWEKKGWEALVEAVTQA